MTRRSARDKDAAPPPVGTRRTKRRPKYLRIELLLGRKVVDADGAHIGRLEEVVAENRSGEYVVSHFVVGRYALVDRLGGGRLSGALLRLLTRDRAYQSFLIPWDEMDLSKPRHLRCLRRKGDLSRARWPSDEVPAAGHRHARPA